MALWDIAGQERFGHMTRVIFHLFSTSFLPSFRAAVVKMRRNFLENSDEMQVYYKGAHGAMVVFDVTKDKTFQAVPR